MQNTTAEAKKISEESKKAWQEFIEFCSKHKFLEIHHMVIKNGDIESRGTVKRKFNRKKYKEQKSHIVPLKRMFSEWSDFIEFCKGNTGTVEILHVQDGLPIYADAVFKDNIK